VTAQALFFGAHPDDVELTSGGLAAVLASHGHSVVVADLTMGEQASRGTPAERAREAAAAAAVLGVQRRQVGLPDLGLNRRECSQLEAVVAVLRELKPHLVVAPHTDDAHPDHVEASHLVKRACYLAGLARFGAGKPFRPGRLMFALYRTLRRPDLIVDISAVWERRMKALLEHRSQLDPAAGPATYLTAPGFLGEVEARARHWGAAIGVTHGEGYCVPTPLAIRDARALLQEPSEEGTG
jgi:bacillithiol biosynthesis deacetylase BshB1